MAPVPLRGKRNEPSFIQHTLVKVAEIRETAPDRMAQQLYENACRALGV
jgi:TatD DNase family protein